MRTLMEYYMYMLQSERESFWDYIELIEAEPDKSRKAIWLHIAEDELDHFSKWVEVLNQGGNNLTDMEKAFYSLLIEEKGRMKNTIAKY